MQYATLPSLSVIIACRNSAATLAETLGALAGQHYPAWWEVVVVDNGSDDGTADVARRFESKLPNFKLVALPDPGWQARGQNHGIQNSSGDCLVFLDSDDVVAPDYLLRMSEALAKHPFVGATVDVQSLNPPAIRRRRETLQQDRIDKFCDYLPAVIGAAMGAQRQAVEAVAGFDESLQTQHDLDLSWRLTEAGYSAAFVPDAVLHYRYRTRPKELFRQEYAYGLGEVVLFRKHRAKGMPRRKARRVLRWYARLGLSIVTIFQEGGVSRTATMLGMAAGRIRGSIDQRTLYL